MKLSSGCTKGGPSSMEGCFWVYVVKTTDALLLFFRHRNLGRGHGLLSGAERGPQPPAAPRAPGAGQAGYPQCTAGVREARWAPCPRPTEVGTEGLCAPPPNCQHGLGLGLHEHSPGAGDLRPQEGVSTVGQAEVPMIRPLLLGQREGPARRALTTLHAEPCSTQRECLHRTPRARPLGWGP